MSEGGEVDDFPSNSRKSREPRVEVKLPEDKKKVEKVVEGEVVRRNRSLGKKLSETFFSGDARGVISYLMGDVLLPAAKDTIADMFSQGIERMLFGEARSTSRRTGTRPGGGSGYINYNRYATQSNSPRREDPRTHEISKRARATHDFQEIILSKRVEAEEVLSRMFDIIAKYESVSVGDLYELLGIESQFTDDKWGWTDIRGAGITRTRSGYLLDLAQPEPLD